MSHSCALKFAYRAVFIARVGRNKRSALRRMGVDGTGIADSRRITLRQSDLHDSNCDVQQINSSKTSRLLMKVYFVGV
jgi:hypothetical protein